MKMSEKTFKRRVAQLVEQLENHPHKDEILGISLDQELEFLEQELEFLEMEDEYAPSSPFRLSLLTDRMI